MSGTAFKEHWEQSPQEDFDQGKNSQVQQTEPCLNAGASTGDNKSEELKILEALLTCDLDWKHNQEPNQAEEPAMPVQQNTIQGSILRRASSGQNKAKKSI